jgi:hypothetical protein
MAFCQGFLKIGNSENLYTDFTERTELFPSICGENRAIRVFRVQNADYVKR